MTMAERHASREDAVAGSIPEPAATIAARNGPPVPSDQAARFVAGRMESVIVPRDVARKNYAWFALVDAKRCRVLCCRLTQRGTRLVEERTVLWNGAPAGKGQGTLTGGGATGQEEGETRFVQAVAEWLNRSAAEHQMSRLIVFASPRFGKLLRNSAFGVTNSHIAEASEAVIELPASALADHTLVRELMRSRHQR